ncbi:TPA: acetolactate synthase large subunit [Salmonella enterica subsp. enterica serovar Paratyphi B]|nr:acetolactate synthase large subunit [Salmonella enterica subsp. enterica serovar Paratyphi B]HCM9069747.1 acetolactate synthase large subunit [Salmonella enterica subsp. enterica serovar Paratyphi B]HCM9078106.1 acetolactate synthase large subunit [Salmonella enterica subsp. enterica serovar Paratyphi B]
MASSGTTSTPQRFTGAEFIVHFLERQGIRIVTGIPGGSILPVYDALSQSTQIRHILARHEQGAGFIAQGMARTEGKPAVCMACSGPGATNLVTAIADARLDSIPLICITGQVPASMIGTDAFQEVDTYGISIPITKHNYLVRNINELPQVMSDAFRLAQSGRPGPVWIDVPKDVQTATIELDALPSPAEKSPPPEFSAESIREAAAMINAVAACVDDNAIITTDVGQHQMWTAQAYPLNRPRQWLTSGGLGTMGFGLPAAIGAALANPGNKVLCFSGDGSLMMNIQEMATASENQLDVKIILMNNDALGLVHQQQSLFYKQGVFAATYPGSINFMQIAAGFGLDTCDLNNEADPQAALQDIIRRPGPALIHVRIDAEEKVYPMVPPGAANTEMVGE